MAQYLILMKFIIHINLSDTNKFIRKEYYIQEIKIKSIRVLSNQDGNKECKTKIVPCDDIHITCVKRGEVTKGRTPYDMKCQILNRWLRNSKKLRFRITVIYRANLIFCADYRKNILKHQKFKEFHEIKKRSISNVDYNANDDLLYLSDSYHIPLHTVINLNEETSAHNEIIKNPSLQNFFLKQKVRKIVAENSHLTLNCPEITMESNVQWHKDNEKLNSSFRNNMADTETEPHLTIDAYNSLYILQATKNEEGVYTCYVDDKPIQTYLVIVVSKSKLLNEEFFRYSIYLGFVLSLTITCYCAGICVAWHQRAYFADPLR